MIWRRDVCAAACLTQVSHIQVVASLLAQSHVPVLRDIF
jgi:hypothetical protein